MGRNLDVYQEEVYSFQTQKKDFKMDVALGRYGMF